MEKAEEEQPKQADDSANSTHIGTGLDTSTIHLDKRNTDAIAGLFENKTDEGTGEAPVYEGSNAAEAPSEAQTGGDEFSQAWGKLEDRLDSGATKSEVKKVKPGELPPDVQKLANQIMNAQ